jgi:hypothetical protein
LAEYPVHNVLSFFSKTVAELAVVVKEQMFTCLSNNISEEQGKKLFKGVQDRLDLLEKAMKDELHGNKKF